MKVLTYADQLNDSRWLARRSEILERDNYCCQDCLRGKDKITPFIELHVHHKKYIDGLMAWEYADDLLITLCKECHSMLHGKIKDNRSDREKPSFVYGDRNVESRPIMHVRDALSELIKSMING